GDLAPISIVGINGFVLLINKDVAAKTLAEFIAYVRARPKILAYAEGSAGSLTHLGMALFLKRAGLEMQNVSYRGNAPALNDIIAGHLPAMFSNISDAVPHAESGAVRLLAVSTNLRAWQLPNIPTFVESASARKSTRPQATPLSCGGLTVMEQRRSATRPKISRQ